MSFIASKLSPSKLTGKPNGNTEAKGPKNGNGNRKYAVYPIPNGEIISALQLQKHPEGGFFAETDRQKDEVPSPFAGGKPRPLATTIYYLLTPDEPSGVFHMNKSVTMHTLHQGRAEYTLIHPEHPPRVETVIVGHNVAAGEKLQLLVGTGVWKKSRLLDEDLAITQKEPSQRSHVGCLISEVVFPGFHWEDHKYMTKADLEALWKGQNGWEEWLPFVKATE